MSGPSQKSCGSLRIGYWRVPDYNPDTCPGVTSGLPARRPWLPWPWSPASGAAPRPAAPACPARPTPAISSQAPADVCIPDGFHRHRRRLLRRLFLAGLRGARLAGGPGHRGVPASTKGIAAAGPRVFETYKAIWEIFHADGSSPDSAFDKYDAAGANPCRVASTFGDVDHRIGLGDRRHRAGGHRRPRPAARRAERPLRAHPDDLQPDRVRSPRQEPLFSAARTAGGAQPAAGSAGDRVPDRIDRRQGRLDRRHRSAARPREAVLHADRHGEARHRRRTARGRRSGSSACTSRRRRRAARSGSGRRSNRRTPCRRSGRTGPARSC